MATAYTFVPSPHHLYPDHPESPARFTALKPWLASIGAQELKPSAATPEEIGRVHRPEFIASLESTCLQGEAIIDFAPTYVTRSSFDDALLAAGATLTCSRAVLRGEMQNAFAIVRPPGHHAEPDRAMGFCLFNNVAVAAFDALERGLNRVAVVDFDAHHGTGTQAAFLEEPRLAYLSTHQWGIYPGSGWIDEAAAAHARIVNVPLPPGSGNEVYRQISETIVSPFLRRFKPELILVSAGYDAHWSDPLTSLGLSARGFHAQSKTLVDLADELSAGRIVFVLEGGYDPVNLANGIQAGFAALQGAPFIDPGDAAPHSEPDASGRLEAVRAWNGF